MPDNKAKIKFDEAFLKRIQIAITNSHSIYNRIHIKIQPPGQLKFLNQTLVQMYQYAYYNVAAIPFRDHGTILKHDEKSVVAIRKAKQYLKTMYALLKPSKRADVSKGYASTLDLLNQFQTHLERMAGYVKE